MLKITLSEDIFQPAYDVRHIKNSFWSSPRLINLNTFKDEYLFRELSIENNTSVVRRVNVFPVDLSRDKIDLEIIMVLYNIVISAEYIAYDPTQINIFRTRFPGITNLKLNDMFRILTRDSNRILNILLNEPPTKLFIEQLYDNCS